MFLRREVMAQLVELLLPTLESSSSNPVIEKKSVNCTEKTEEEVPV